MNKQFILFCLILFVVINSFAQTKPKPKEKAPTQQEMQALMKEAQKAMDDLSPEDKKMMENMGIKMPSFKNTPNLSDKQLAAAFVEDGKVIPSRKTNLINELPKKLLSTTELKSYVQKVNTDIGAIITPKSKAVAEKIIAQYKNDKYYGAMIASAANGMWIMGLKEPAVYLMGKAVEVLPNADNYNSYGAFLTMTGAAHMAIPVLEKLNSVHKKNSTILNNLGQAWLQLGERDKAEKYLDSAILIYANHPQANYTKCLILESEGKTAEAAVAIKKSMQHSVTKAKMQKLKDLEGKNAKYHPYQLKKTYFSTSFDLGSYVAMVPLVYSQEPGPKIADIWDEFREKMETIKGQFTAEMSKYAEQTKGEVQHLQSQIKSNRGITFSPYYYKAVNAYASSDYTSNKSKQEEKDVIKYMEELALIKQGFEKSLSAEKERFDKRLENGENLGSNSCDGELPIIREYLNATNILNKKYREQNIRKWVSDAFQAYNYVTDVSMTEGLAQLAVLQIKLDFIEKLSELNNESYENLICTSKKDEEEKSLPKKLPDFDKVNCKMKSTLYVPYAGQMTIRCNEMDVVFNPGLLPFKASWTEDFNTNTISQASIGISIKAVDISLAGSFDEAGKFQNGSVSVGTNIKGVDVSAIGEFDANGFKKGSVELGMDGSLNLLPKEITDAAPVELGVKGEMKAGIELGADGIEDMYVSEKTTIEAGASAEADIGEAGKQALKYINEAAKGVDAKIPSPKLEAGASISADNRMGVNSGYSAKGSSEFSGLHYK
ncbi:MAG: hypothetical protein WCR66_12425 [Bacteroidota bacterium]